MILCYTIINNFNLASKIKRRGGESDALDTLIQNKSPHRPRRTLFFSNCLHYAIILLTQREKFMIKNKIKNLFISVSMAFLFALMCIMPPLGSKKASAQSATAADTLYYYSDYNQSPAYCQSFVSMGLINDYVFCYGPLNDLTARISADYNAGVISPNSYIVLELRNGFSKDNGVFISSLYNLFGNLKEHGCKIMFIDGTNEIRYVGHDAFLDYVDIHINVDVFFALVSNMFLQACQTCGGDMQLRDLSFILDKSLTENIEYMDYQKSWFFNNYFDAYFKSVYESELLSGGVSRAQLLQSYGIQTLCHTPDDTSADRFYALEATAFTDLNTFLSDNSNPVFSMGATYLGQTYSLDWIRLMTAGRTAASRDFPIYIHNDANYAFGEYSAPDVYPLTQPDLFDVMADFLADEDMTVYNNVEGRCIVTYCPLCANNGWLADSHYGDGDFYVKYWKLYLTQEEQENLAIIDSFW